MWILVSCGVASTDRRMPALPVSLCSRRATPVAVRGVRKADHRELSSRSESRGARRDRHAQLNGSCSLKLSGVRHATFSNTFRSLSDAVLRGDRSTDSAGGVGELSVADNPTSNLFRPAFGTGMLDAGSKGVVVYKLICCLAVAVEPGEGHAVTAPGEIT